MAASSYRATRSSPRPRSGWRCGWRSASATGSTSRSTRDEREYLSLARSLAAGHGFVYDDAILRQARSQPFGRAPGYPAFLALVGGGRAVDRRRARRPSRSRSRSSARCGVLIVGLLAGQLGGRSRRGDRGAGSPPCYPPLVWIAAYAFSEALFWPIGLGAAWLVDRASRRGSDAARPCARCSRASLTGVAMLVRPATIVFLGARRRCGWLWRRPVTRAGRARAGRGARARAVDAARNYAHHGRFVLVASEGGVTFWTGNHPLADRRRRHGGQPELKLANQALQRAASRPDRRTDGADLLPRGARLDPRAPVDWLALEARKVFYLVVPIGPSYRLHSRALLHRRRPCLVRAAAAAGGRSAAWRLGAAPRRGCRACGCSLAAAIVTLSRVLSRRSASGFRSIDPALDHLRGRPLWRPDVRPRTPHDAARRAADLQRAAEPRARRRRRSCATTSRGCSSSTTSRRTARARSRTRWRRSRAAASRSCTARARAASAWPTSTACARARRPTPTRSARWTPTSRTIRSTCRIWSAALERYDLVIGSRYLHGISVVNWPLHRIALSAFANRYIRFVTGLRAHDCTSGVPRVAARGAGEDAARSTRAPTATRS